MNSEILTGIFGLIGVIVGSGLTILYQFQTDKKNRFNENRQKIVARINNIDQKISATNSVLNKIISFTEADLYDEEAGEENSTIMRELTNIYNDKFPYYWEALKVEILMFFPATSSHKLFEIFDKTMTETKTMSEDILEYLSDGSELYELQNGFIDSKKAFIQAYYMNKLFHLEFRKILTNKTKHIKKEVKAYYRENKSVLK